MGQTALDFDKVSLNQAKRERLLMWSIPWECFLGPPKPMVPVPRSK